MDFYIEYNNLQLLDTDGYIINNLNADGLEIRLSQEQRSARHGVNIWRQLYGARDITFEVKITAESASDFFEKKRAFYRAFSINTTNQLSIRLWNNETVNIGCKVVGLPSPTMTNEDVTQLLVRVELRCEYPFFSIDGNEQILTTMLSIPGGVEIPTEVPFSFTQSTEDTFTFNNNGDIGIDQSDGAYPEFWLYGEVLEPYVRNLTTGGYFWLDYEIQSGHYVHIFRDNTALFVLLDDQISLYEYFRGDLFELEQGLNTIKFTATGYNSEAYLKGEFNSLLKSL